jgi:hypothetical protein
MDGRSLFAQIRDPKGEARSVYSEVPRTDHGAKEWKIIARALKRGRVKLIEAGDEGGEFTLVEDFDFEAHYNRPDAAEVQAAMQKEMAARVAEMGTPLAPAEPENPAAPLPPETIEALRVLGYGDVE